MGRERVLDWNNAQGSLRLEMASLVQLVKEGPQPGRRLLIGLVKQLEHCPNVGFVRPGVEEWNVEEQERTKGDENRR